MKKRRFSFHFSSWLLAVFLAASLGTIAQEEQEHRSYCYTDELLFESIRKDPKVLKELDERDRAINAFRENILPSSIYQGPSSLSSGGSSSGASFTIPVVVYIVHNNGTENITDLQVTSQIDKLNDEFSTHGIKFCLATKEGAANLPGGTANPGIIRIQSPLTNHLTSNESGLKALSTLPADKYLRIWVVKDINSGSGILGYARFPGSVPPALDGIVMRYDAFGDIATCGCTNLLPSNNQGKVLAHEVGHYLNLYHTFHNGCAGMNAATCDTQGDRVCDTPPVASNNSGCPAPGSVNSCNEVPDLPDLLDNHMDYTNDNCRNNFTTGQETRMICAINLYRSNLVSSSNLVYTGVQCNGTLLAAFSASSYNPCHNDLITFTATSIPGATYNWTFGDLTTAIGNPVSHSYTTGGTSYTVTLTVTDGTNTVSESQQIYVTDCSPISSSQGNWYFYEKAGLDFSSGVPVADDAAWVNNTITDAGSGSVGEACADQSDNSGNLLFYTDAIHVWNENHALINSGNDLFGSVSAAGGTIIVPNPGTTNEYCIFTSSSGTGGNPNGNKGLRYSKVLVTGTAASMGTVNIPVVAPAGFDSGDNSAILVGEGITAVASCNGYWIICNARKSGTRYLVVYELTSTGINYVSQYNTSASGIYAVLDAAPDGSRLARAQFAGVSGTYLYDFNKSTGIVSGETQLNSYYTYGVSFSPSSERLYVTSTSGGLYQYDMTVGAPATSQVLVSSASLRALQIGPDDKVYAVKNYSTKLGVIHQPDLLCTTGTPNACSFDINGPALNTIASGSAIKGKWGLPNMLDANTSAVYANSVTCTPFNCYTYKFEADYCASTFSWNFGDPASGAANTSTLQNPTHTFSGPGTYTVTVNAGGTIVTKTIVVGLTINIAGPATVCLQNGSTYNYSVTGAPAGATFNWSASGGSVSGLNGMDNADINWTTLPGTVTVTVTDPATGCTATKSLTVIEDCSKPCKVKPNFYISVDAKDPCKHYFTNSTTIGAGCSVVSWSWNFGDPASGAANTSNLQNPTHVFSGNGTYNVCLTVTVNCNGVICSETICYKTPVTHCNPCPCDMKPNFKYKVDKCEAEFYDASTGNTCTQITGWYWNFGDPASGAANTSNLQNPTHVFSGNGTYVVCLTVYGYNGTTKCKEQICYKVTITDCNPCPCDMKPNFKYKVDKCEAEFYDASTGNTCTQITGWHWDFGDPASGATNTSNLQNPTHVFSGNGTYTVCLTVYGNNGTTKCKEQICYKVVVTDCNPCPCDMKPNFLYKVKECKAKFYDASTSNQCTNITGWSWNFGDPASGAANTSNLQNPTHVFSGNGTYTVCLTIYGNNGTTKCKEQICYKVKITDCKSCDECDIKPAIKWNTNDNCTFDLIGINTATICPSQQYEWNIYDGSGSFVTSISGQSPTYTFPASGVYKVCLTIYVLDANGNTVCKEQTCEQIKVSCKSCDECDIKPYMKWIQQNNCTYTITGANLGTMCPTQQYEWNIYNSSGALVSTQSGMSINYTFPGSGTYKVCLTIYVIDNATGNTKCKEQLCKEITVQCKPCDECDLSPAIKWNTTDGCTYSLTGINNGTDCPTQLYTWSIYNSANGSLVTTLSGQNPTYTFVSGTYKVCLTIYVKDAKGNTKCKKEFCDELKVVCRTPMAPPVSDDMSIKAVPNPTSDYVSFILERGNVPASASEGTLMLFDAMGSIVLQEEITLDRPHEVDVTLFKPGTYYYRVKVSDMETATEKLVIIR